MNRKALFSLASGAVAIGLTLIVTAFAHRDCPERIPTTMLVSFTGIALGWLLGFAASPKNSREEQRFSHYGKLVAGVVTGYLLGRFEPSLDVLFKDGRLLNDPVASIRLMVFTISTIVAAITMFVFRSYLDTDPPRRA